MKSDHPIKKLLLIGCTTVAIPSSVFLLTFFLIYDPINTPLSYSDYLGAVEFLGDILLPAVALSFFSALLTVITVCFASYYNKTKWSWAKLIIFFVPTFVFFWLVLFSFLYYFLIYKS